MKRKELDSQLNYIRTSLKKLDANIKELEDGDWRKNVSGDFDKEMICKNYRYIRVLYRSLLQRSYDINDD